MTFDFDFIEINVCTIITSKVFKDGGYITAATFPRILLRAKRILETLGIQTSSSSFVKI